MLRTLVVPIDGSEFATHAVDAGAALARGADAEVRLVGIARSDAELAWTYDRVHDAELSLGPATRTLDAEVFVDPDPSKLLLDLARDPRDVLCLARHDHAPLAAVALRSVGSRIIERAVNPLFVVGPSADVSRIASDVVVALDGRKNPSRPLAAAAAWAMTLHARLRIVTVYEPVAADLRRPDHFSRHHGPPGDPAAYLDSVVRDIDTAGVVGVDVAAISDPVEVAAGIARHLEDRPARVVVCGKAGGGSHVSSGVLGHLIRALPIPILIVKGTP